MAVDDEVEILANEDDDDSGVESEEHRPLLDQDYRNKRKGFIARLR